MPLQHSQLIGIVMAMELDLSALYFRVVLKNKGLSRNEEVYQSGFFNKEAEYELLASTVKLPEGKVDFRHKRTLKELRSTVFKWKKTLSSAEEKLAEEVGKSPYLHSLLMATIALTNTENEDRRDCLQEALKGLEKCYEMEREEAEAAVGNSIFLFSSLWQNAIPPVEGGCFKELYVHVCTTS